MKEKAEKEDNLVQPTLQLECQNQHREQVPKANSRTLPSKPQILKDI